MSSSKNTIFISAIISLLNLVLTYFIGLNISYNWFEFNWLSNSFLLTVFGGTFTSSFVVLLCEIRSYKLKKRAAEDRMYSALIYLYSQLTIVEHALRKILKNPFTQIPKGMFIQPQQQSKYFLQEIVITDYTKFWKWGSKVYSQFCLFKEKSSDLDKTITEFTYFDMAVISEQINDFQSQMKLSESKKLNYVNEVSASLIKKISEAKQSCDNFLIALDDANKYGWKEKKNNVNDELLDNVAMNLKEYIKENK